MAKIVKGEILKSATDNDLKDFAVPLPKEKHYYVTTDENGNIKGYFPLKEKTLGKDWVAMYQQALKTLAKWNLPNEQYRVMLSLLGEVDFDNYLTVNQTKIADELGMRQSNVARAIKGLNGRNIIVEGPPAGKFKTYRLNPYIAHKGKNRSNTIIDFESAMVDKGKNMLRASDVSDFNQKKSPSNAEEENEEKEN